MRFFTNSVKLSAICRTVNGSILLGSIAAATPAVACTLTPTPGIDLQQVWRTRMEQAPIVVEGYVKVAKMEAGKPSPRPVARLITRKTFKGPQRNSYPLNYSPTSCDVQFPTDKKKRQKVYLEVRNEMYSIVSVEPIK